jgi:hypothetical protein
MLVLGVGRISSSNRTRMRTVKMLEKPQKLAKKATF